MRRITVAGLALLIASAAVAQQAPAIGPTFGSELVAAGCADGVGWVGGALTFASSVSAAAQACAQKVLGAHDPTKKGTRRAPLSALLDPLSAAQRASITVDHMERLQADAVTEGGTLPITNTKIARAAADLGLTPDAWFTTAGY